MVGMKKPSQPRTNRQLAVFAGLQGLDVLTTLVGFAGGASEANPVIAHFLPMLGPVAGLVVGKLLTVAVIFAFMYFKPTANTKNGWRFVNVGFGLVIVSNLTVLARIATHLV
jgi:Domain of unknown function (DUF5658)